MRLTVFLDAIGVQPNCEGQNWTQILNSLLKQYQLLPVELRREARRQGRMLIHDEGLTAIAAAIVSGPPPTPPKLRRPGQLDRGKAKCSRCGTWNLKSIWETREAAETFCLNSNDSGLRAYECPHGNGWHVGHRREEPNR